MTPLETMLMPAPVWRGLVVGDEGEAGFGCGTSLLEAVILQTIAGRCHLRTSFPHLPSEAVTLVGTVRVVCSLLFIGFLAAAATIALTPLPPPAAGGTCGPGTSSESAIAAFLNPASIGAGPEPSATSGARSQWLAFISECQSTTDSRVVTAAATLAGAVLLGLGLPWVVRRLAKASRASHVGLPPPGWYPDPTDPSMARWWDGGAWGPAYAPPEHQSSASPQ
jgi:Protein of unknown function (DUF2510)